MTAYKGFKFRLYPTKEQAEQILVRPGWPEPNVCGECDLC